MAEHQMFLPMVDKPSTKPAAPPELRDEIAQAWDLPINAEVEVAFRPSFSVAAVSGRLELRSPPRYPWNPHDPLALRVAGCDFTSRDIESWKRV